MYIINRKFHQSFIQKLRNFPSKTSDEWIGKSWTEWEIAYKNARPYRYQITEIIIPRLLDIIEYPFVTARITINGIRWKSFLRHYSPTTLRALKRDLAIYHGQTEAEVSMNEWMDVGDKFLPCMFGALVDFVECELASCYIDGHGDKDRKNLIKKYNVPFWASRYYLRYKPWRCKEAGLAYINEVMNSPIGIETRSKYEWILNAYTWWTVTRPSRATCEHLSGYDLVDMLSEHCDRKDASDRELFRNVYTKISDNHSEILKQFDDEDERWMIEMIKNRHNLWS